MEQTKTGKSRTCFFQVDVNRMSTVQVIRQLSEILHLLTMLAKKTVPRFNQITVI